MENNSTYNKIEAYLEGSMPEPERQAFEQTLAQDAELATQVKLQRFERDAMELLVEEDLRSDMKTWKREMLESYAANNPDNIRRLRLRRRRYLAIAASFLVIVTAAALLWLKPFERNTQDIAANDTPTSQRQNPQVPNINPELAEEEEQPIAQITDPQRKGTEEEETEPSQAQQEEQVKENISTPIIPNNLQPQVQTAPQVATQNNTLELATQNFDDSYLRQQNTEGNETLAALVNTYSEGKYGESAKLAGEFKSPYPLGQEFLAASLFKQGEYLKAQQTYNNLMRLSVSDKGLRERTEWNLLLTYLALDQTNYRDFDSLMSRIRENKAHQFFDEADALFNEINN